MICSLWFRQLLRLLLSHKRFNRTGISRMWDGDDGWAGLGWLVTVSRRPKGTWNDLKADRYSRNVW
jgi:hypothetical protein